MTSSDNLNNSNNIPSDNLIINNNPLFRQIEEISNIGFWIWNCNTDTLYWSDQLYKIYGVSIDTFKVTFNTKTISPILTGVFVSLRA